MSICIYSSTVQNQAFLRLELCTRVQFSAYQRYWDLCYCCLQVEFLINLLRYSLMFIYFLAAAAAVDDDGDGGDGGGGVSSGSSCK